MRTAGSRRAAAVECTVTATVCARNKVCCKACLGLPQSLLLQQHVTAPSPKAVLEFQTFFKAVLNCGNKDFYMLIP